jgi:mono/diheme cytochrome c family protein
MMKRRFKIIGMAAALLAVIPCIVSAQSAKPALHADAQATAGAAIYASSCATCHGAQMEGVAAPALKGAQFSEMVKAQALTPATLLEVIANTMPQSDPGSLKPEEYAAVTAYILQQNGNSAGTAALASRAAGLKDAKLAPNSHPMTRGRLNPKPHDVGHGLSGSRHGAPRRTRTL